MQGDATARRWCPAGAQPGRAGRAWAARVAAIAVLGLAPGATAAAAAERPAGASRASPATAQGLESRTLLSGGLERRYQLHRPPRALPGAGLVFVLHGSNGDVPGIRAMLGQRLEPLADQAGFLVVYPEGIERYWNDCRGSASYLANRRDVDDPAFLRDIVAALRDADGIDPRRVFAIGLSNGGQLVLRLAFEDAAAYAGLAAISANLPAPANNDCRLDAVPSAIVLFTGTDDPVNPFHGGLVRVGNDVSRGHVLSAGYSASWFAKRAGQPGAPRSRWLPDRDPRDRSRAELLAWDAAGRPPVALYVLHGGGHTVPGAPPPARADAPVINRDIDAATEAWRFFMRVDPAAARSPGDVRPQY